MALEIATHVPERIVTNDEIASWQARNPRTGNPFSAQEIFDKLGIQRRYVAGDNEQVLSMASEAVSKLTQRNFDAVFFSISYPDGVNNVLELSNRFCPQKPDFKTNVHGACSGFVMSLVHMFDNQREFRYKRALIATGDIYTRTLPPLEGDPGLIRAIFSDGATATSFVMDKDVEIIYSQNLKLQDSDAILMPIKYENVRKPAIVVYIPNSTKTLLMHGSRVLRAGIAELPSFVRQTIVKAGLKPEEIKEIFPHQASGPMLNALERSLPEFRIHRDIEDGNFSSGSIPMALKKALDAKEVNPGDILFLLGFGAGLFASAAVVRLKLSQ